MREGDIIAKQFWGDIIANLLQSLVAEFDPATLSPVTYRDRRMMP
jgi:hypothetical protein